jgi:hypothetical protein
MTTVEERLADALWSTALAVDESDDLFARVQLSIEDDQALRRQRRRRVAIGSLILTALATIAASTVEVRKGAMIMDWWILETLWFATMIGLALWLGPFIRRFGKSYAADVFRINPRTGKSFIVLMDVAYYLIFLAYTLFTVHFEPDGGWAATVSAQQMRATAVRFGGIFLIIGVLHGLNVLALPFIGRVLTLNRRLDDETEARDRTRQN